jgi:hypothetical protein
VTTFGLGPTFFGTTGGRSDVAHPGVALHVATRIPFEQNLGIGLRFAWGLTEFRRMDEFAKPAYDIGKWTTNAYVDVYNWAAIKDDARLFRWMGAFFAFAVLWMPYIVSGVIYALTPLAPTTYLEGDLTFNYDVGTDKLGTGPYFKGGLAALAYLHPRTDKLFGGLGPTAGFGVRVGKADIGIQGTWLPPKLHGDNPGETTSVFIGSLLVGVSGN